jgi:hypothetical protein
MATQSQKTGGPTLYRDSSGALAPEKPRKHEELGLCLALVVLLAWALFVGLRGVDWSALGHSVSSLVAWIG